MLASLVFYRVFSVACRFAGFVAFTTYVPSVIRLCDGAYLNGSLVVFVVGLLFSRPLRCSCPITGVMLFLPYLVAEWVHITCCGKVTICYRTELLQFHRLTSSAAKFLCSNTSSTLVLITFGRVENFTA